MYVCMYVCNGGSTISHAATMTPAMHRKTDRKSGWFSNMPFIQGRPTHTYMHT